jgi:hypothetical protein
MRQCRTKSGSASLFSIFLQFGLTFSSEILIVIDFGHQLNLYADCVDALPIYVANFMFV